MSFPRGRRTATLDGKARHAVFPCGWRRCQSGPSLPCFPPMWLAANHHYREEGGVWPKGS
eukprot:11623610-Prorocentrum_lima.AAC.1